MDKKTEIRILALAAAAEEESRQKSQTKLFDVTGRFAEVSSITEKSETARYLGHVSGHMAGEEYKKETE